MNSKVSFLGLLALLLIGLKLGGIITWSWFYVTMPLWGPLAVCFGFVALLFLAGFAFGLIGKVIELVAKFKA